jgi:hypothetical protein
MRSGVGQRGRCALGLVLFSMRHGQYPQYSLWGGDNNYLQVEKELEELILLET